MVYSRYIVIMIFFALAFPTACGSSRKTAVQDPVAQSGTGSEEIWYQYGGARVAYTAVTRPKQLYTGYGAVRDPALYGQAPTTTQEKAPSKKRVKPKAAATPPPRDPNCPPCPPAETAKNSSPPQGSMPQSGIFSAPVQQGVAPSAPLPSGTAPSATGAITPPPIPSQEPLSGMPAAIPAPMAPNAPGT